MLHQFLCEYGSVLLRPLQENDIEPLRVLRNSQREFFFNSDIITEEMQKTWYIEYLNKRDDLMCAVELRSKPGLFVGAMALYDIKDGEGKAEFGRALVDKELAPDKGTGRDAVVAICLIGFRLLHLRKITCVTMSSNTRSISVYKKVGFRMLGDNQNGVCHMELYEDEIKADITKLYRI